MKRNPSLAELSPTPVPLTAIFSAFDGVVDETTTAIPSGDLSFEDGLPRENIEIVGSHCGMAVNPIVLIAVCDAESRTRFLGYRVESYKLFVFTLSACMAGVAGALYVPQVGIINPGEFAPENSIEVVIWAAVGGRGVLVGPIVGAIVVNFAKTWLTGAFPDAWLYALGASFILVTIFLPKGVLGLFDGLSPRRLATAAEPKPAE